jgi:hypothetical protein
MKFQYKVSKMRELHGISQKLTFSVNLYDGYVADLWILKISEQVVPIVTMGSVYDF